MKKVFISGIGGNMGKRYAHICDSLGVNVLGCDMSSFVRQAMFCHGNAFDGIIVATPTHTHLDAINIFGSLCPYIPILVEKPIEIGKIKGFEKRIKLTMVNQYKYLVDDFSVGPTYYDYFKTGGDGLFWDCINIIGLAKGEVRIKNDSTIWQCMINGKKLSLGDMDNAYVDMIKSWMEDPSGNMEYAFNAHRKVQSLIDRSRNDLSNVDDNKSKANKLKTSTKVLSMVNRND